MRIATVLFGLFVVCAVGAYSQTSDSIKNAQTAYTQESWDKAFAIVRDGVPETGAPAAQRTAAAEFLVGIGVQEFNLKNYKNAYESFKKALKYEPTNTTATQYFLRIRREMTVANLQNEGGPRATQTTVGAGPTASGQPENGGQTTGTVPTIGTVGSASVSTIPVATMPDVRLDAIKADLESSVKRLQSMESTVANTSTENTALRSQVNQQLALIQTMLASQRSQPSQTAQGASKEERALVAQTMELLAKMADKESAGNTTEQAATQEIKELVSRLDNKQQEQDRANYIILASIFGVIVLIAGSVVFVVLAVRRSRKQKARPQPYSYDSVTINTLPQQNPYASISAPQSEPRLLAFVEQDGSQALDSPDLGLRKDLLKAEHLKRMYDEVRAGNLSWNTVRNYISELEVSLKAEILKVVENKLNEGDFVSGETILPVIFPFLSDYDDFLREKSEQLAKRALITQQSPSSDEQSGIDEPLSLKSLMLIPQKLQILFKKHDQTLITAKLSRAVGNALGLSKDDCNLLYKAAIAHDCGYLMLDPDKVQEIISKAEITEEDFDYIKSHVLQSASYFGDVELPARFKEGIVSHHERNDGSGYPDGLKKDEIPLFAKIIGICETFATLISKRAYREKRDLHGALSIIADGSRTKFDSAIVAALTKVASSLEGL